MAIYELHIRRGTFFNDDPQKRCYNGCYFAYHYEWSEWENWMTSVTYESKTKCEFDAKLFARGREDLQFKVVKIKNETI